MKTHLLLALAACCAAPSAYANQTPASAAAKGRITPLSLQVVGRPLSPAETTTFTAKVEKVLAPVMAAPSLADPHGFSIARSLKVDAQPSGMPSATPARAEVVMIVQEIDLESGAKPDAAGAYMGRLEGPTLRLQFNDQTALFTAGDWGQDYTKTVRYLPAPMRMAQGFPVVRVGARDVIVIAKPGRSPLAAVTKQERLEGLIAETRADMARIGGAPHPKMQARLDGYLAELAALPVSERDAPACESSRLSQAFGDCAAANATFLVRLDPAYFTKGGAALELVTISTPAEGGHGHKRLEPRLRQAAASLDLPAIQAMLD